MHSGSFALEDVQELTSVVTVNGIQREHISWSRSTESSLGLPAPIVQASGIRVSRATVTFPSVAHEISHSLLTPWTSEDQTWPPLPGQPIIIDVAYLYPGETTYRLQRRFTGTIDTVSGGLGSPLRLSCIDAASPTARITLPPRADTMPGTGFIRPYNETDYFVSKSNILPYFAAVEALDASGYGFFPTTTPETEEPLVQANLQGSVIPTVGDFMRHDEDLEWVEEDGILRPNKWVRAQFEHTQDAAIVRIVTPNSGCEWKLYDDLYRGVWVQFFGGYVSVREAYDGTEITNFTLPQTPAKWTWLTVKVTPNTQPANNEPHYRLEFWDGNELRNTITLNFPGARGPFIQAAFKNTPAAYVSGPKTFTTEPIGWGKADYKLNYRASTAVTGTESTKTVVNVKASELLKRISEATCTGIWVDEFGTWQWWPLDRLLAREPVATLDAMEHIGDLSWTFGADSRRSIVKVGYLNAAVTVSMRPDLKLWQSDSSEEVKRNSSSVQIIEPPQDSEWLGVEMGFRQVAWMGHGNNGVPAEVDNVDEYNTGEGSFWGISAAYNDGDFLAWPYYDRPMFVADRITPRKIVLKHSLQAGTIPPDGVFPAAADQPAPGRETGQFFFKTATIAQQFGVNRLQPVRRGQSLPILRGQGYVRFSGSSVQATSDTDDGGTVYTHPLSYWGRREDAHRILDMITPLMTQGLPLLENIPVRYDPRYQLGDKIVLDAEKLLGTELTCLISSISEGQAAGGEHHLELGFTVVASRQGAVTYGVEQNSHGALETYAEDQQARDNKTYAVVTADPLED